MEKRFTRINGLKISGVRFKTKGFNTCKKTGKESILFDNRQ
ncbi:MAG: hypothetical protein ACI9M9_000791 [Flavobacteriaceae bacterium]|jgi:hypothetical protein